ncbi:MAG: BMC domain-containing protein [Bilophila sp.]
MRFQGNTSSTDTLGIVECRTIATGVALTDAMLKLAPVELLRAATVCSGWYLVFIAGDRDSVQTSVAFAAESGRGLLGSYVLSNIDPQVLAALKNPSRAEEGDAVAIIEARTSSSGVAAADKAVKEAPVRLIRLVPGEGITGKSYFVLCGTVAAVEAGAEAARSTLGKHLVDSVVLARPEKALLATLGR